MRKLLILMLVLGIASAASAATITFEYRDAAGTTPIASVLTNTNFTLVVIGTYAAAESGQFRMYDQFENLAAGSDHADFTGATMNAAAGGFKVLGAYSTLYDGYDFNWGDASTGQTSADMFVFDLTSSATTGTLDISSYDTNYTTVLDTYSINVTPEPMTIVLLGLGGLFLRRRK